MKTCCVTGHRDIPADKIEFVNQELRGEILKAIEDGYTRFISGFATGTDLIFASIVAELKQENSKLQLEAAIPYRNRLNSPDKTFKELIRHCNMITVHGEEYTPNCFMIRNRAMVQDSQRVIAVYDGREKGGTYFTICYARTQETEVTIIKI